MRCLPWVVAGILLAEPGCGGAATGPRRSARTEAPHPSAPKASAARPAPPTDTGPGLDAEQIRPVMLERYPAIRGCHSIEHAGASRQEGGHITVDLVIRPNGTVSRAAVAESTFPSPALQECVLGVTRDLKFPRAAGSTELSWKFKFRSDESEVARR